FRATSMTSVTTASVIVFMRFAALARSTSSSKRARTPIKLSLRSTRQMALAPDFLYPNETQYLSLSHTAVRSKPQFALTRSNNCLPPLYERGFGFGSAFAATRKLRRGKRQFVKCHSLLRRRAQLIARGNQILTADMIRQFVAGSMQKSSASVCVIL